ncbi:C-type lectin domain family 4 member D-like [Clinocottus analis]|uniref:C-type lectin domain family 4 member D-like n=1 Tax=Clinocottus analis TaxID=304258 RepID=UPI0035C05582
MEEEIVYSTVVFNNRSTAPKEKKENPINDFKVKPKEAATVLNGKAATRPHSAVLAACLGTLCVLVASISVIIYLSVAIKEQRANLNNLTAEHELLIEERSILSRRNSLIRDTDNLNWTLRVIRKFNTFPVNDYCPDDSCQPCQKDWIQFQEKCYLFYNKNLHWKTWRESKRYCQNAAADLVVIDNLHEQTFLTNHIKFYYDKYHGYWLGLHENQDNNWVWVDGKNATLGYWQKRDFGKFDDCGLMIPSMDLTTNWAAANCYMRNIFICEIDVLIWSI